MKTITKTISGFLLLRLNIVVYSTIFIVPFLITKPQLLTGSLVNCLLFLTAEKMEKKNLWPIIILPSLAVVARGVLFGPQTIFMYYFLPFIWIGNYLLVFSYLKFKNANFLTKILLASTVKYFFLLFAAQNYFALKIVPKIFVTSMGLIQFITALIGGLLAYSIIKLLNKNYDRT